MKKVTFSASTPQRTCSRCMAPRRTGPSCSGRSSRLHFAQFVANLPPCIVAMEACASAHHWARELARQGHAVRLIAPHDVKPFPETAEERRRRRRGDCRGGAAADNAFRRTEIRRPAGPGGGLPHAQAACEAAHRSGERAQVTPLRVRPQGAGGHRLSAATGEGRR